MGEAFEQITLLLPQLTSAELDQVAQRIKMLHGSGLASSVLLLPAPGNQPSVRIESDENWVLQTICEVMAARGLERASPGMLRRTADMARFRDKLPGLLEFLRQTEQERIYQRALLAVAVDLLYSNLNDMGVPISVRTLIRHIHRIPAVLDIHFPGYARFGMLRLIIRDQFDKPARRKRL